MSQQPPRTTRLDRVSAILSMNSAMLCEISPSFRAIQIKWSENLAHLFFFFEGEISYEDRESAECIATEFIADYPGYELEVTINRLDYPAKIPEAGVSVYRRRE